MSSVPSDHNEVIFAAEFWVTASLAALREGVFHLNGLSAAQSSGDSEYGHHHQRSWDCIETAYSCARMLSGTVLRAQRSGLNMPERYVLFASDLRERVRLMLDLIGVFDDPPESLGDRDVDIPTSLVTDIEDILRSWAH